MKKLVGGCLVLFLTILLTGCLNGEFHVTVNNDGSGDLLYRLSVAPNLLTPNQDGDTALDEFRELAEQRGFTIAQFKENGHYGIEARKHVEDISTIGDDIFTDVFGMSGFTVSDHAVISVDEGFLFNTYNINMNLNLKNLTLNFPFANFLLDQINLKMFVTLPLEATEHNASQTHFNEAKTYQWDILLGHENEIYLQLKVPNIRNMMFVLFGIVLFVSLAIYLVYKKNRRTRE